MTAAMRIATITNWAYGATVALTIISGATMLLASGAEDRERAAVEQRARFDELTADVKEDSLILTEQAREYVLTGDPTSLIVYRREAGALRSVEDRIARLKDAGAGHAELASLKQGLHWADALVDEQQAAIDAARKGDEATGRRILFSAEYERELERVAAMIDRFQYTIDQRTEAAVRDATQASRALRSTSEIMLGITALLFLCVLYFIIKQRILHPVVRLSDIVTRLAAEDFEVTPPEFHQVDEIGDMALAISVFRQNGLERQRLQRERDADWAMRDLLARMTQRLQGCDTADDLTAVVGRFAPEIAPSFAGRLYIHDARRNAMTEACQWLSPIHSRSEFPPSACWALRRGQTHRPESALIDIPCEHLDATQDELSIRRPICTPLTAQGETIGLLYFERREAMDEAHAASAAKYLEMLAENIGLALANLRLRDTLREMALVDPLTGLANRRQFDVVLAAQALECERTGEPMSCLVLDVDHFKRFNDNYGHDAGGAVLRAVGTALASSIRGDGIACRHGGEEFVLLMPRLDLATARERAEEIRRRIQSLHVEHGGKILEPVTVSIGLAAAPIHGTPDTLVRTADAALLRAKAEGRDRVIVATVRKTQSAAA